MSEFMAAKVIISYSVACSETFFQRTTKTCKRRPLLLPGMKKAYPRWKGQARHYRTYVDIAYPVDPLSSIKLRVRAMCPLCTLGPMKDPTPIYRTFSAHRALTASLIGPHQSSKMSPSSFL
ncbi:hypothetical protein Adt_22971 [Abeliophyllum distichum]|uniref:Uncharacterized protein n=1 Tax=Abeliophyllum distichum TaxID=126358 RepID=A0ABD1S9I4_9LAMI